MCFCCARISRRSRRRALSTLLSSALCSREISIIDAAQGVLTLPVPSKASNPHADQLRAILLVNSRMPQTFSPFLRGSRLEASGLRGFGTRGVLFDLWPVFRAHVQTLCLSLCLSVLAAESGQLGPEFSTMRCVRSLLFAKTNKKKKSKLFFFCFFCFSVCQECSRRSSLLTDFFFSIGFL